MDTKQTYIATTLKGLEDVLEAELKQIGVTEIVSQRRSVSFLGDLKDLYHCNLSLRTAIRILWNIKKFDFKTNDDYYKQINAFPWENYMNENQTFKITNFTHESIFKHSNYASQLAKDAIVDRFKSIRSKRPDVSVTNPDITINLHIVRSECIISLDSSGEPLFKRGYRNETNFAPLNECIASGILLCSGYDGSQEVIDPMCGSGTFSLEAAQIGLNRAANIGRETFAFENWPNHRPAVLEGLKLELKNREKANIALVQASDIDVNAIRSTRINIAIGGFGKFVEISQEDFFRLKPKKTTGLVFINPPYDIRLKEENIIEKYREIGFHLKENFKGYKIFVLSANQNALKNIGLKPNRKRIIGHGGLDAYLYEFEVFPPKPSIEDTMA